MPKLLKFIVFILLAALLPSCEKESDDPVAPIQMDYRTKWVGDYEVASNCYSWILGGEYISTDFIDTVAVRILEGSTDSLTINGITHIPIDSAGQYSISPFPSNYYILNLWSDSIYIRYNSGGLGGGSGCTHLGFKLD